MRPDWPAPAVLQTRSLPQYRLPGCWKWRSSLKAACRDYAFRCWMAKYNCDEQSDYVQEAADYDRPYKHMCDERCWEKSREYMQRVVDRYARLLERKLRKDTR